MIFWKKDYLRMLFFQIYSFYTRLMLLTLQVFFMPVAGCDNLPVCIFKPVTAGYPLLLWMSSQFLTSSHRGLSVGSLCCNWAARDDLKCTDSCLQRISNTSDDAVQPFLIISSDVPDMYCHHMSWRGFLPVWEYNAAEVW